MLIALGFFIGICVLILTFRPLIKLAFLFTVFLMMILTAGMMMKALINYSAASVGMTEPFVLPLDQPQLLSKVSVDTATTTRRGDRKEVFVRLTTRVENRTDRPLSEVTLRCTAVIAYGNEFLSFQPIPVQVGPFGQGEASTRFVITTPGPDFERDNTLRCALYSVVEGNL